MAEQTCRHCGKTGIGKHCSYCGQSYATKRITLHSIIHEVFHFFTHLDKGFFYTLKELTFRPGTMQRAYIDGHRVKHQKPFSMFFVCGSATAFALYLIHKPAGEMTPVDEAMADFRRHYYVLLQAALLPLYAFVTWLLFRKNRINYAESLVFFAYTLSFMLLLVIFTNIFHKLTHGRIPTWTVEVPVLLGYLLLTNFRFFKLEKWWGILLKSVINIVCCYFISTYMSDLAIRLLTKS